MSGGYLKDRLKAGEHRVVIFTFKGEIDQGKIDEWDKQIKLLKQSFGNNIMGVTIKGEDSPF